MDETIRGEYGDLFPFANKPIMEVKKFVFWFFFMWKQIVYHPLSKRHKDKIKTKIMRYNSIEYICAIFVLPVDPNKIAREKPKLWADIKNSISFLLGGQHIIMVIKVGLCRSLIIFL
jgi:hypothetical protein